MYRSMFNMKHFESITESNLFLSLTPKTYFSKSYFKTKKVVLFITKLHRCSLTSWTRLGHTMRLEPKSPALTANSIQV